MSGKTGTYNKWTKQQEETLKIRYKNNVSKEEIAKELGRTTGAIQARLEKLGLEEPNYTLQFNNERDKKKNSNKGNADAKKKTNVKPVPRKEPPECLI
jgi:predicted DNA-binding protein YlxM (UPF0122 family)